jgi:hypothetical protein
VQTSQKGVVKVRPTVKPECVKLMQKGKSLRALDIACSYWRM